MSPPVAEKVLELEGELHLYCTGQREVKIWSSAKDIWNIDIFPNSDFAYGILH